LLGYVASNNERVEEMLHASITAKQLVTDHENNSFSLVDQGDDKSMRWLAPMNGR
jgi:hypothetical protein